MTIERYMYTGLPISIKVLSQEDEKIILHLIVFDIPLNKY